VQTLLPRPEFTQRVIWSGTPVIDDMVSAWCCPRRPEFRLLSDAGPTVGADKEYSQCS
jgi:hypothetical protein